jgi:hypothetical protein
MNDGYIVIGIDEDKTRLRNIFEGRTTVEETVRNLVRKHTQKSRLGHERI